MSSACKRSERPVMVLLNGLAEQEQTWFANVRCWRERFEVHQPVLAGSVSSPSPLLSPEGRGGTGAANKGTGSEPDKSFSIERMVATLREYIDRDVGRHVCVVANSMGGKVAIEFAVRHAEMVSRLVLLAPSGLTRRERLPILAGLRVADSDALVRSVFHDPRFAPEHLFRHYRLRLKDRAWRRDLLQTVRATAQHRVRHLVSLVRQPTLVILGTNDRIVDQVESARVAHRLLTGRVKLLRSCGHAPQIERADEVNRLVVRFLLAAHPVRANRPIVSLN